MTFASNDDSCVSVGAYYLFIRDPQKAIEEFSAPVGKYPADSAGHANLALACFYQRDMVKALEVGRRSLDIYPKNLLERNNVALYAVYAGDFDTARAEAEAVTAFNPGYAKAYIALGLAELGLGRPDAARATYERLASQPQSASAVSLSSMATADLLMYQGHWREAVSVLEQGIAGDSANDNTAGQSGKLIALAEAQLELGRKAPARAAVEEAIGLTRRTSVVVPAARLYVALNENAKADALAKELGSRLQADPRAYAKLIEGEVLLAQGNAPAAIRSFRDAATIADTWLGRHLLGRAYIEAKAFAEAHSELELCLKRRGEATAVFLDDIPSYRYFPATYYYAGVAQKGLQSGGAVESFERYLEIRGKSAEDRFAADARRQISSGAPAAP